MPEKTHQKTSESSSASPEAHIDTQSDVQPGTPTGAAPGKTLPPEAVRALEEAALRRGAEMGAQVGDNPTKEINGPRGLEPTRYGDWERKGVASDF